MVNRLDVLCFVVLLALPSTNAYGQALQLCAKANKANPTQVKPNSPIKLRIQCKVSKRGTPKEVSIGTTDQLAAIATNTAAIATDAGATATNTAAIADLGTTITGSEICVMTNFGSWFIFRNVRNLNGPLLSTPLSGFFVQAGSLGAATGTAVTDGDGTVVFGVTMHGGTGVRPFAARLVGDASFTASGSGVTLASTDPSFAYTWTPVACDSITVPDIPIP